MDKRILSFCSLFLGISFISICFLDGTTQALRYSNDTSITYVDASYQGYMDWAQSGASLDVVGDVNGDGYDDILIGAPEPWAGRDLGSPRGPGWAYLIFGKPSDWSLGGNLSDADASFFGEFKWHDFGTEVAGGGDVNGDGYDDFIIGAPNNFEGGGNEDNATGQVYVIFGKKAGWKKDTPITEIAGASFIGEQPGDFVGQPIDIAGDVNGDGYDDILISAETNCEGGGDRWHTGCPGQVYIIFGKKDGWAMDTPLSKADASFWGEHGVDFAGWDVSGGGDVNGDGFNDIIIGAFYSEDGGICYGGDTDWYNAGEAYLIFGKENGWAMDISLAHADASFLGNCSRNTHIGSNVEIVGDINGDGFDDILVGENSMGAFGARDKVHLIFGGPTGWHENMDLNALGITPISEGIKDPSTWGDGLGQSMAGVGDVNGDGIDDLIFGAPSFYKSVEEDEFGDYHPRIGKAYLVLGKQSGWIPLMDISSADASFIGDNILVTSDFARTVAGNGDVNGDGYDDIVIGTNVENGLGLTYIIFPDINKVPTSITAIKAFSGPDYQNRIYTSSINDTVYIELSGTDGDPNRMDTAEVNVTNIIHTLPDFRLRLKETGLETGIYRGNFDVMNRSNDDKLWINASLGDKIRVSSWTDPTKYIELEVINGTFHIKPKMLHDMVIENSTYYLQFRVVNGGAKNWVFDTNASWLSWDESLNVIKGVPEKKHIGEYWVSLNTSDDLGNFDEMNFTVTVQRFNHPPMDVRIIRPEDWSTLTMSGCCNVTLEGSALDIDEGDILKFIWFEDDQQIAEGNNVTVSLNPGFHDITLKVTDGQSTVVDYSSIQLNNPEPKKEETGSIVLPPPLLVTTTIVVPITLCTILFAAFTEVGRFKATLLFTPLYSRIRKEAILDNFTRGKVYQYVTEHPGAHIGELVKALDLKNGLAVFHLDKLEKEKYIVSKRNGLRRCYYPFDLDIPHTPSIQERILNIIRLNPGISQKDIAIDLVLSRSTVNDYIRRMKVAKLVKVVRTGKKTQCYIIEDMEMD